MMKTRTRVLSIGPIPFPSFPLLTVSPLISLAIVAIILPCALAHRSISFDLVRCVESLKLARGAALRPLSSRLTVRVCVVNDQMR